MTFIKLNTESRVGRNGQTYTRKISVYSCDYCGAFRQKQGDLSQQDHHYCSNRHLGLSFKTCGKAFEARKQTYNKNWGVSHSGKSERFIEKLRLAYQESMGVDNPFQDDAVKLRSRQRMLEKYGVEYSAQSIELRSKIEQTNLLKLGVKNPAQDKDVYEKIKKTNIKRYGFRSPLMHPDVQERRRKTCIARYGTEHPHSNRDVREKYYITLRANQKFNTSKPEERCYQALISAFDEASVTRWCFLNGWNFDASIQVDANNVVLMQIDGVYWHGLDRPLKMIKEFKTPRDYTIFIKYECDRQQDAYCLEHGLKLVRITDMSIKEMSDDELIVHVKQRCTDALEQT